MRLDRTQIGKIIHNVLSYEYDEEGRLHFNRFTKSQYKAYEAESYDWLRRAVASASVTFDFITDSEYIALKMDLDSGSSQIWSDFDLYVDGIYCMRKKFGNMNQKLVSFELPEGEHRITLYFPWTVETIVNEVHLSDGASIKEVQKKAKAIVIGDSITQGYITEYTSLTYANQVARETDIDLVNQGIGGYYFGEGTIDESLVSYQPDLIIIAYGTNDYSRYDSKDEFKKYTSGYIEKLTSLFPNTKMLAVLPIYRNDENNQTREKYRDYTLNDARNMLLETYKNYKNIHVLKETGIPHIPDVFIEDYLHPNELGFTFMAKAIVKEVEKILQL